MNFIFDLDGTLIDSALGIRTSLEQAVKQFFPDIDPITLDLEIGPPQRVILRKAFRGVTEQLLNEVEAAFDRVYASDGWKMTVLYPKVKETLDELRLHNIRMFLVTNKLGLPTKRILSYLDLSQFFSDVICPDSRIPPFQDKAEGIACLLNKHNLSAEDSIYIGDTPDDLSSAKACGVTFIGFQCGYGTFHQTENTICLLNSFSELLETSLVQCHLR